MNETTQQQVAYDDGDEIDLLDILVVIAENLRLLILGPVIAGLTALGISFLITPTFTATTTFMPPQQQQSAAAAMLQTLGALGGVAGAAAGIKNPAEQYVALTGSRSVEDAIIKRFDLQSRYEAEFLQDARKKLEDSTRIKSGKDGLIKVEVDERDPKLAAAIANAYVDELSKLMNRLAVTEAQQRRAFFEQQLAKTKEGLTQAETTLKGTGVGSSAMKASPEAAVGAVAALMAQVTAKEVELGAMRNYLTDSAPQFKRAQSELAALRAQLDRAEKDTAGGNGGGDYVAKYRDFKYYETLFELMAKQYEIARIDESREGAVIQVVDSAIPADRKSKPKRIFLALFAALATAFSLLIFVFARKILRNFSGDSRRSLKLLQIETSIRQLFRSSSN